MELRLILICILCTSARPTILADSLKLLHPCWTSPPLFNQIVSLYCLIKTAVYPDETLWPSLPRERPHGIVTQAPVIIFQPKEIIKTILIDTTIKIIEPDF
jgi:hypothetical protein